jgi:hypothetical protein
MEFVHPPVEKQVDGRCAGTKRVERRKNSALADSIDVGIIYFQVYGPLAASVYFQESGIPWHISLRIISTHRFRRRQL